jgi:hypothetical protein
LLLSFRNASDREVKSIRKGACEFALATEGPAVFLLYRFAGGLPWSDAPYSVHILPEQHRPDPAVYTVQQRLPLWVLLVDSRTAIIQAQRVVTLSHDFSVALAAAVNAQLLATWPGKEEYDRQLAEVYRRHPTTESLLATATVRTKGGA